MGFKNNQHVTLSLPATVASCLAATTREKTVLAAWETKEWWWESHSVGLAKSQWRCGWFAAMRQWDLDLPEWGLTLAPKPTALTMFTCQLSDMAKQNGLVQHG